MGLREGSEKVYEQGDIEIGNGATAMVQLGFSTCYQMCHEAVGPTRAEHWLNYLDFFVVVRIQVSK